MIYNHNIITKEQKQAFVERKESRNKIFFYGIIVALLTFSLHFMLQTLTRSVLSTALPQLMMPSYFSTLSLYIVMAFILYTAYMIRYYDFLTLYICGLIDLIFLSLITMSASLFISRQRNARYVIIIGAVCIWMLRLQCGYYHLISDRIWMSTPGNLFDLSQCSYLLYFIIMIILCVLVVVFRAKRIAQYTNFPFYERDMDMGEDVNIVVLQEDGYREVEEQYVRRQRRKGMDTLVNLAMVLLITAGVLINVFVLFVSLSSPERETNFFGVIPFVFHTESMEPQIMYNDLAFFDAIDKQEPLHAGHSVLYHEDDGPQVASIKAVKGEKLSVDILKYTDDVKKGAYEKVIARDAVYGRYSGRSRWLGAIILFANTVLGRLILLLIPAFMLYYYKPILAYLKKKGFITE